MNMRRFAFYAALVLAMITASVQAQVTITNVYTTAQTPDTSALGSAFGNGTETIAWSTNVPATSQVRYGYDIALQYNNGVNPAYVTTHTMTLTGLSATRPYYFAVVSNDSAGHTAQSGTQVFAICGSSLVPVVGTVNNYYQYGSYMLTWVPPSGSSGTPMVCGQPLQTTVSGSLSGGASFSAQVGDAFKVIPGPGTWNVAVTDAGNLSPISVHVPISTVTSDVSSQLQMAASGAGLTGVLANTITHTFYPAISGSGGGGSGATGPTGPIGATGATGATGPAGVAGTAGTAGVAGRTGATGATGMAGTTGNTGPVGIAGSTGSTGATGPSGTGATGPTGPMGSPGYQGYPGVTGATGATGAQGIPGTAAAMGATGPTGSAGVTGATGLTGATGPAGTASAPGSVNQVQVSNGSGNLAASPVTINSSGSISGLSNITASTYYTTDTGSPSLNFYYANSQSGYNYSTAAPYEASIGHVAYNFNEFGIGNRSFENVTANCLGGQGDCHIKGTSVLLRGATTDNGGPEGLVVFRNQAFEAPPIMQVLNGGPGAVYNTTGGCYFALACGTSSGTANFNDDVGMTTYQTTPNLGVGVYMIDTASANEMDLTCTSVSGGTCTVSQTLTASLNGTTTGVAIPNSTPISSGYYTTETANITGTITAGMMCANYGAGVPDVFHVLAVSGSSGNWTITARFREPAGTGSSISCGGLIGRYMQAETGSAPLTPSNVPNPHLLPILSNTINSITTGYGNAGATASGYMSVGTHPTFPGAMVVDVRSPYANNQEDQFYLVVAGSSTSWTHNDNLEAPNMINEVFDYDHWIYQLYNPFSTPTFHSYAMLIAPGPVTGIFNDISMPSGSSVTTNYYRHGWAGYATNEPPSATYAPGSPCAGVVTEGCVANVPPGYVGFSHFYTFTNGGSGGETINGTTHRFSRLGTDFSNYITMSASGQAGQRDYLIQMIPLVSASPFNLSTWYTDQSGNYLARSGFAQGLALSPNQIGGGYTTHPVTAAANLYNFFYFQLESQHFYLFGQDSETTPFVDFDPTNLVGKINGGTICTSTNSSGTSGCGTGGGGGTTYTFPTGLQYGNNSTSAPTAATPAQLLTAMQAAFASDNSTTQIPFQYNTATTLPTGVTAQIVSSSTAYPAEQTAYGIHGIFHGVRGSVTFSGSTAVVTLTGFGAKPVCTDETNDGVRTVLSHTIVSAGGVNWTYTIYGDGVTTGADYSCGTAVQ